MNPVIAIFLIVMLITTFTDIKYRLVFNWLLYPAIFMVLCLTFNWIDVFVCFFVVAALIKSGFLKWFECGGDVKVMMFVAACFGWIFVPVLLLTRFLVILYRRIYKLNAWYKLPVTPFAFTASVITLAITVALHGISL
jgi:hypothetical protein